MGEGNTIIFPVHKTSEGHMPREEVLLATLLAIATPNILNSAFLNSFFPYLTYPFFVQLPPVEFKLHENR